MTAALHECLRLRARWSVSRNLFAQRIPSSDQYISSHVEVRRVAAGYATGPRFEDEVLLQQCFPCLPWGDGDS